MRSRVNCSAKCKRYNYDLASPCLWGSGNRASRLMLIGRDPGRQEDRLGKVFVGESGRLLDEVLHSYGVARDTVYVTNAVKCGTPGVNVDPGKNEIMCCRSHLEKEIAEIKPNVLLVFGNTALQSVLGQKGISNFYNQVIYSAEFNCKVIPTYHPAFVLRDPTQRKYLERGIALAVREMSSLQRVSSGFDKTKYIVVKTREVAHQVFDDLEKVGAFAFDTETSSLSFIDTTILCLQFSWCEGSAVVIPWSIFEEYSDILERLKLVMRSKKLKIAHNIKFDIEQLLAKGVVTAWPYFDVCVAHGLVDDNSKHGLDVMSLRYTNLGSYWNTLERFKKEYCKRHKIKLKAFSYADVPKNILYPYGATDADATYRLFGIMRDELIKEETMAFFKNYSLPYLPIIVEMEYRGILVDREKLAKLLEQCLKKLEVYNKEIGEYPDVVKYEKWKSKKEAVAQVHFLKARRKASAVLQRRFPEWPDYVKKYLKLDAFKFNMNSALQIRELFCDFMGCKSPNKTKGDLPSVGKETLIYFAEEKGIALAAVMNKRRRLAHFIKHFVSPVYTKSAKDGRIHTNYIQTDARTGRLSSRDPNLQNLSRNENLPVLFNKEELEAYKLEFGEYPVTPYDFKSCFLADPGYTFIKADLAQVEFRVWAHCSGDEDMIRDIEAGLDIHRRTASELFEILEEAVTATQRNAAKGGTFGMMYGIGDKTLAKNFKITLEQAQNISEIFSARYPIAAQWLNKQIDFAHANGYVVSFLGRKRRLPKINDADDDAMSYAERQARNSPIQGPASDMNNKFMEKTIKTVRKEAIEIYPVMTTHDENVVMTRDNETTIARVKTIMSDIVATAFPMLRCKMKLEFKVGGSIGGAK